VPFFTIVVFIILRYFAFCLKFRFSNVCTTGIFYVKIIYYLYKEFKNVISLNRSRSAVLEVFNNTQLCVYAFVPVQYSKKLLWCYGNFTTVEGSIGTTTKFSWFYTYSVFITKSVYFLIFSLRGRWKEFKFGIVTPKYRTKISFYQLRNTTSRQLLTAVLSLILRLLE
jgi:hypothetical protein